MIDRPFWSRLEYSACRWLASSSDPRLRHFWIDGFLPEAIRDTKAGVDVQGIAWVGEGQAQHRYRFVASLPERLLRNTQRAFVIDRMFLDKSQRVLELAVCNPTQNAEPGDSPNDGPATSVGNSDGSGGGRHR